MTINKNHYSEYHIIADLLSKTKKYLPGKKYMQYEA